MRANRNEYRGHGTPLMVADAASRETPGSTTPPEWGQRIAGEAPNGTMSPPRGEDARDRTQHEEGVPGLEGAPG